MIKNLYKKLRHINIKMKRNILLLTLLATGFTTTIFAAGSPIVCPSSVTCNKTGCIMGNDGQGVSKWRFNTLPSSDSPHGTLQFREAFVLVFIAGCVYGKEGSYNQAELDSVPHVPQTPPQPAPGFPAWHLITPPGNQYRCHAPLDAKACPFVKVKPMVTTGSIKTGYITHV